MNTQFFFSFLFDVVKGGIEMNDFLTFYIM